MTEFIEDEGTQIFFTNLFENYFDEEELEYSFSSDDVSFNCTAELFDQLEISTNTEVNEDIDISEKYDATELEIERYLEEYMVKWRTLQAKKREFFSNEVKKMELSDTLLDRMKKFFQKWDEYEDNMKCDLCEVWQNKQVFN